MSLNIRLALPTDTPILPSIEEDAAQVFRSVEGLEWLADQNGAAPETYLKLIECQTVWIAESGHAACGFVAARIEQHELHIVEVSVRSDQQRKGIARALIETAAVAARRLSLTALTLTTFRDLPWNEKYYTKLGFARLEEAELSERLEQQLGLDTAAGLPRERRCAMVLRL